MRLAAFALLLSAGTVAFCQSAATSPANPEQNWLTSPGLAQPGRDFTKAPPEWHFDPAVPVKTIALPAPLRRWEDAQIDPKIVMHPAHSSVGEQPPRTLVAQNLYPGLLMQPIQESQAKEQPIPTTWSNLKVQNIPIVWPKFKIKPVESSATESVTGK